MMMPTLHLEVSGLALFFSIFKNLPSEQWRKATGICGRFQHGWFYGCSLLLHIAS
jgi:hypothetical protein